MNEVIELPVPFANELLAYLAKQPYEEVYQLIPVIQNAQPKESSDGQ